MAKKRAAPRAKTPAVKRPEQVIPEEKLHRYAVAGFFVLPLIFWGRLLFGPVMTYGTDFLGAGGYAARQFMAEYIRNHLTIALWQPQILCGQPTVAAFFGDLFYPTIFLRLFLPVHIVWAWTFYIHTVLAGLGTYLFIRELKVSTLAGVVAGVAYMFSGSLMTLAFAGHDGRLIGSALMPWTVFLLIRGLNRRQLFWFVLTGLVLGLQLLSGHIQKVYYTVLILVAWFIFNWVRMLRQEKEIKSSAVKLIGYFGLSGLFAIGIAAIQYLPIYANLPYSARGAERGYEFATSWSMPIAEIFDLLTPKFSGGLENYWSKNPFKLHSEYLGILPLLFAFIALIRCHKTPIVRFFSFTVLFAVLMAWGGNTPFYRLPYYLLPGISKFRGPGMIFFVAGFALAVLAGYGVNYCFDRSNTDGLKKTLRALLYAGAGLFLLLLFFLVARDAASSIFNPGTRLVQFEANYPSLTSGMVFAVFLWLIGIGIVYLPRAGVSPQLVVVTTVLIMTLDVGLALKLWDNQRGYIRSVPPPQEYFAPDEVVRFLRPDSSFYRVLPLNYERSDQGILWLHGIYSTGGQIPNPLQSYQDFIGAGKSVLFQANNLLNSNFMNLLNVKYVITYNLPSDISRFDPQSQQVINQLRLYFSQPQFEQVFAGTYYAVYYNRQFLPRAFIVHNYEVVRDKDELLSRLMQPDFDPSQTALLYTKPEFEPGMLVDTVARCSIVYYDANRIKLSARLLAPGLLILSENYHPDWQVKINGKSAQLLPAFHTLRAVVLEVGEHQVEFTYYPKYYRLGMLLTLLTALAIPLLSLRGTKYHGNLTA